jgi:hypothetical protein
MDQTDHWGECAPTSDGSNPRCDVVGTYKESMSEVFNDEGMIIYEPCNYASNIAYYHSATRICDYPNWSISQEYRSALKRGFSGLAMGSAFWHGSHTYLGNSYDNNMIAIIFYVAY